MVGTLLWQGAVHLGRAGPGAGPASGAGGTPAVNFFTLPPGAPAAVDVPIPPPPPVQPVNLPPPGAVTLDLPRVEGARDSVGGRGTGAGSGAGAGEGGDSAAGSGTGGESDYIFVASPRTAILPPLAKVPGSVAGRTYRLRFSVAADGRVTLVDVDPPISNETYRRDFLERMMAYRFYPARTRDGRNVASVVTVPLRIGN